MLELFELASIIFVGGFIIAMGAALTFTALQILIDVIKEYFRD
jgi:hypothetical protein